MNKEEYKADFLWPHDEDSIEEAGYEFANAKTEEYQHMWWNILIKRIEENVKKEFNKTDNNCFFGE